MALYAKKKMVIEDGEITNMFVKQVKKKTLNNPNIHQTIQDLNSVLPVNIFLHVC